MQYAVIVPGHLTPKTWDSLTVAEVNKYFQPTRPPTFQEITLKELCQVECNW